ncbi:MAG: protein phosphatase 2C domain-containing protein [Acidimicrobiales bacterium]
MSDPDLVPAAAPLPALEPAAEQPDAGVYSIGDRGMAADVEGLPALVAGGQPDALVDAGAVGDLVVRLASVRGAGHRYDATVRQDDAGVAVAGPDGSWLVVAVADGVSAGRLSHLAARAVVRGAAPPRRPPRCRRDPAELDWDEIIGTLAAQVLLLARRESGDEALEARDAARVMASTVALAVVPTAAEAGGARTATVVPVGDTSAWVLRAGTTWEPVTAVKNAGEAVASSATIALPLLPTEVATAAVVLGPGDALLFMTEGVGDPLGDGTGEVAATLAAWWAAPPSRWAFAAQVDFGRRSHTDDRSAVGVWLPPVHRGSPATGDGTGAAVDAPAPPGAPAGADPAGGDGAAPGGGSAARAVTGDGPEPAR